MAPVAGRRVAGGISRQAYLPFRVRRISIGVAKRLAQLLSGRSGQYHTTTIQTLRPKIGGLNPKPRYRQTMYDTLKQKNRFLLADFDNTHWQN